MTKQIHDTPAPDARACLVPLSKLSVHAANVRRTDKRADIEALAASIAAHGLLQNLSVVRGEDGRYGVIAGARRLAALRLLAKDGRIAKDFAAPCTIVDAAIGPEASLAENIQRVAMHPMDEMEAFVGLANEGMSVEDIAIRFGATVRHVEQRLALGRLSPKLRAAYRKSEITLDVARAFCLSDDHATQERIFKQFGKPITYAQSVRAALAGGRIRASDKLARFVGVEAYVAAGGRILRDLFDEDVAFLEDGDILQDLASQRCETLRQTLLSEGWAWAEVQLNHGQIEGCASERIRPDRRPLTAEETKAIAALETEIERLDGALETADDNTDLWDARDAAEAELDALQDNAQSYDLALMAHAGVLITIGHDGAPAITKGLIKRADLKAVRKQQRAPMESKSSEEDACEEFGRDEGPRLSKKLLAELTGARTRGLRAALAQSPRVALALLVHVLLRRSVATERVSGVEIEARPVGFDDVDACEQARSAFMRNAPQEASTALAACLEAPMEDLAAWLSLLVAETLDVTHVGLAQQDEQRQKLSDALACALDLDMTHYWQASAEFWERTPKGYTIAALESAPALAKLSEAKRRAKLLAFAKMKKAELARNAARLLGPSWLPDILITPPAAGAFALTAAGRSALNHQDASSNVDAA